MDTKSVNSIAKSKSEEVTVSVSERRVEQYMKEASKDYKGRFRNNSGKFLAYTTGTRQGFNPFYWRRGSEHGHSTYLSKKGMHQEIEIRIIEAPDKPVGAAKLSERFGCDAGGIRLLVKNLREVHGLKPLPKGGANFKIPDEFDRALEREYLKVPRNGSITEHKMLCNAVIAADGIVPSYKRFIGRISALEAKHAHKVKVIIYVPVESKQTIDTVIAFISSDKRILKKGIKLRRFHELASQPRNGFGSDKSLALHPFESLYP